LPGAALVYGRFDGRREPEKSGKPYNNIYTGCNQWNGTSSKWNDLSIKCSAADPSRGFLSSQQESIFQSVPPSAMDMNREGDPRIPVKIHCKSGGSCILHGEANPIQSFLFSCSNGNFEMMVAPSPTTRYINRFTCTQDKLTNRHRKLTNRNSNNNIYLLSYICTENISNYNSHILLAFL
jgi:hypothetical protein